MAGLYEIRPGGELRWHLHPGQWRAWQSPRRWVLVLAGTQSGKTSFGPIWLWREIQRQGPGDYMVVTPSFPLLELKALPEFRKLFEDVLALGRYVGSPVRKFVFSPAGRRRMFGGSNAAATTVFFGYAAEPDSLESATAKAVWCDEAGQKRFRLGAWEAIKRRLAIHQGRALLTTTPYDLGWLKQQLFDRWKQGAADVDVINFASTMNPVFPRAEYDAARSSMPAWKFNMFYRGLFERPAGLIYDCVGDGPPAVVERFAIPDSWPRYWGLDFGGVHTACLKLAGELSPTGSPTGHYYGYQEYLAGGRTAAEHVAALLAGEPRRPARVLGGSKSEKQWRSEFGAAGLGVEGPDQADVEVGLLRSYGAFKSGRVHVFSDLGGTRDELGSYSRELDAAGEPTGAIADKETFHRLDAARYVLAALFRDAGSAVAGSPVRIYGRRVA